MPEFYIKHQTLYSYPGYVHNSANKIILYPLKDDFQDVQKHELKISGDPGIYIHKDYYGNDVGNFTLREPHYFLEILSTLRVITKPRTLPQDNIFSTDNWSELERLRKITPYIDYLTTEYFESEEEVRGIVNEINRSDFTPFKTCQSFCKYVFENFEYIPGITNVETTPDEIWKLKAGVCQDFAHILLVMLRQVHIPARYVSGYICPNKNGMRGEGATHAWVEAYIPHYGWLGLDPTNNSVVNDLHVRLAVGRNFTDCSPVKGIYKGQPEHKLQVNVTVSYDGEDMDKPIKSAPSFQEVTKDTMVNSFKAYQAIMEEQQQQQQQQQQFKQSGKSHK